MNPSEDQQDTQPVAPAVAPDYPTEVYQPAAEPEVAEDQGAAEVTQPAAPEVDEPPVSWTAKEYVELSKGSGWYIIFALVVLGLIAVDIFLLKSITFSVLVVVMAISLIVYARRPPREIQYTLSGKQGLYIGDTLHHLSEFRAFGLIQDGDHHSIMLIPVKRFAPGVSVYFPEEAGEQIVDILGQRLPMETLKLDVIDVIVRKLRL